MLWWHWVGSEAWFIVSLYPDEKPINLFFESFWIRAVFRQYLAVIKNHSSGWLAKRSQRKQGFMVHMTGIFCSNWLKWSHHVDFVYLMGAHTRGALVALYKFQLLDIPSLVHPSLYTGRSSWRERVECFCNPLVHTPPALAIYSNSVVHECLGTGSVWHIAVFEVVKMMLVQLLHASNQNVYGFQC